MLRCAGLSCLALVTFSLGCSGGPSRGAGGSANTSSSSSGSRESSPAGMSGDAGAAGAASGGVAGQAPWQLRALTYNAALAPAFEPLSSERAPKVVAALSEAAAQLDVMCVQEFWLESDFASLLSATKNTLGNALRPDPKPGTGTCTAAQLTALATCQATECGELSGGDLVGCLQGQCRNEIQALPGACLGCLFDHVADFSLCAGTGSEPSDPAIFGGDFDIGLLSRYPLQKKEILPLDAYFQRGAVLYAEIEVPKLGPVHAFCTHLSSSLGVIPYAGPDGSWDGEHTHEVEQLVNFIQAKAGDSEPVLVMGDLNMGVALQENPAVLPEDFGLLLATGLSDPFLDSGMPACSECGDNSFRGADSTDDLIDHLLVKRFPGSSSSVTRAFTEPVSLPTAGDPLLTNLSDHYGLRLAISPK